MPRIFFVSFFVSRQRKKQIKTEQAYEMKTFKNGTLQTEASLKL